MSNLFVTKICSIYISPYFWEIWRMGESDTFSIEMIGRGRFLVYIEGGRYGSCRNIPAKNGDDDNDNDW